MRGKRRCRERRSATQQIVWLIERYLAETEGEAAQAAPPVPEEKPAPKKATGQGKARKPKGGGR